MQNFAVDIASKLPTILVVIEPDTSSLTKSYVYANAQVLALHDGDYTASAVNRYYYLHDRLGSVRMLIDDSGSVTNTYMYNPFGEDITSECSQTVTNPWKYTGQYFDAEIDQYYLRARQYDPHIARFTVRDPLSGDFKEPLTLHAYLYCLNDPIGKVDPSGEFASMWMRAKDAAVSYAAKKWAEETILGAVSAVNGALQGWMNMLFGPDDISDKEKFRIGFIGGFGEMQIGMRFKSAALGATVSSTFIAAANAAASDSDKFMRPETFINIGLAAAVGAFGDYAVLAEDKTLNAIYMWTIGVDAAMAGGLGQMGYEYANE